MGTILFKRMASVRADGLAGSNESFVFSSLFLSVQSKIKSTDWTTFMRVNFICISNKKSLKSQN